MPIKKYSTINESEEYEECLAQDRPKWKIETDSWIAQKKLADEVY